MALVKYNNNSISAVSSLASLPSGALVPIKTLTASSSSTLSFVHGSSDVVFDSTYPIYVFKFISLHPSASGGVRPTFQLSTDGGSNYNTTMTTTSFRALHAENDSSANLAYDTGSDQAQGTAFQMIGTDIGDGNDESCSGTLHLFNPSSTTFVKHFIARSNGMNTGAFTLDTYVAGYANTTSACNAVQFKFGSGNIDAGTIKLYGIKDS